VTEAVGREDGGAEFWQTEPGWVLLGSGDGDYLPFNQITSMSMLVCDEDEHARVTAGMRVSGCPIIDMPGRDDLSVPADIYVDRVSPDALKVLVELRRLLSMEWPFSDLHNLIAAQPIRAGARDVTELRSALTARPHLRPYLFQNIRGRLVPIWPGT
jgi:hypothetical protein